MAFFKTTRWVFTLALDFRVEGEDDREMYTLITSLEMKKHHPLRKILQVSFIRIQVVFTATIVRQKIQPLTQSPTNHLSVHVPGSLE